MKQVTGNNQFAETSRELSIQITLSGFSFSVSQNGKYLYGSQAKSYEFETIIGDPSRYTAIYIGWDVDTVQLIPSVVFDSGGIADYVHALNLVDPLTVPIYNDTLDRSIVAVWTVNSSLMQLIENLMPAAYHYHNLQVDVAETSLESVRVSLSDNSANVVVCTREGLYAAETIRFFTVEDLFYFVQKMNSVDKFARHSLEFIAVDVEPYRGIFSRHYRQCDFIQDANYYHTKLLRCE